MLFMELLQSVKSYNSWKSTIRLTTQTMFIKRQIEAMFFFRKKVPEI